jgi:hypothetical protein
VQRHHVFAAVIVSMVGALSMAQGAVAQQWATKMFSETSHNFGTVARNAKVEYRFQFSNPYKEPVHVAAVSSSCGCTSPEIVKRDLATYERSEVIARFNTRAFTGNHAATLTVTIDRPYYATVQLNVSGDIRGDIEVQSADSNSDSGMVDFGTVDQGEARERKMTVVRYGRDDWQITDVRSVNSNYEVEVVDGPRVPGKVSYELIVRLKKDAAPGYLHDPLILVTNDPNVSQVPIEVEGVVKAELNVSPQVLTMGTIEAGQQVTKPLIITGHKPFKIVTAHCDDDSFSFKIPSGAAKVRMIPITFTAPNKPGKLLKKIAIETDLGKTLTLEVLAEANVTAAPAESPVATVLPTTAAKAADPTAVGAAPTKKQTTPSDSSTPNVLKLDSGDGTTGGAASGSPTNGPAPGGNGSDATSGLQIVVPAAKPTSVMPNPVRTKTAPAPTGSAAAN